MQQLKQLQLTQGIEDLSAVLAGLEETQGTHTVEVLRYRGLWLVEGLVEGACGQLSGVFEERYDLQPDGVPHQFEHFSGISQSFFVEEPGFSS